jgi:O-acetylhomoserine/O-acetylserine sulfhydrylase-like pyridoxal-dependent enzyme
MFVEPTVCIVLFKKYGISVKFVTSDDPAAFAAAIDENTKAVYVESIGNPKYNVSPISEIAKVRSPDGFVPTPVPRYDTGRARAQSPADC